MNMTGNRQFVIGRMRKNIMTDTCPSERHWSELNGKTDQTLWYTDKMGLGLMELLALLNRSWKPPENWVEMPMNDAKREISYGCYANYDSLWNESHTSFTQRWGKWSKCDPFFFPIHIHDFIVTMNVHVRWALCRCRSGCKMYNWIYRAILKFAMRVSHMCRTPNRNVNKSMCLVQSTF